MEFRARRRSGVFTIVRCRRWRLLAQWQTHLPMRGRKQAAVGRCEALWFGLGSAAAERAGRWTGATVKSLKQKLSASFGVPIYFRRVPLDARDHPPPVQRTPGVNCAC